MKEPKYLGPCESPASIRSPARERSTTTYAHSRLVPCGNNPSCFEDCEDRDDWERRYIFDLLLIDTNVNWPDIHRRLLENPSLATPVPLQQVAPSRRRRVESQQTPVLLHEQTLLGSLCSINISGQDVESWRQVAFTALSLCPEQVACNQKTVGHTALRDGVCNSSIPHDFLESMVKVCPEGVHIMDVDGLSPIDHVLFDAQLSNQRAFVGLDRIRILLKYAPIKACSSESSPLIRFLASGYSSNLNPHPHAKPGKLLQYCKLFIDWDPRIVSVLSKATSCSILHIAIRNYGNLFLFIEELLKFEGVRDFLAHRNRYGDLPLHVACAAGVPTQVLRLILHESLLVCGHDGTPHPLVWTTNEAGYTPIDLEWMRHIESGRDFFSNRGFYQLDARGVRTYGNAYDSLLRETVQQVISKGRFANKSGGRFLLERIILIIKCATCFKHGVEECFNGSDDFILHKATNLAFPVQAFLPHPIIELILWLAPEQASQQDSFGRTPLHYAVTSNNIHDKALNGKVQSEWHLSVAMLLHKYKHAASVYDRNGMLPIHLLLGNATHSINSCCSVAAFDKISFDLVEVFPQALEIPDPNTKLLPFQAAASSELVSLQVTFKFLRACPEVIRPESSR